MLNTIRQAIRVRETREKLGLMLLAVFLTRVVSMVPVPGVDATIFKEWAASNSSDAFGLFSAFTGGSFENFSIFALGITPYITASIVMQLFTVAVTPLAELQHEGEHGRRIIKRITTILALVLAAFQSLSMALGFSSSGYISGGALGIISTVVFMTLGTGVMVWLANFLTEHTIGEGTSILLAANIVSRLPGQLSSLFSEITEGRGTAVQAIGAVAAAAIILAIVVIIILMNEGYHPLKVQYSMRIGADGDAGGGIIPIKVGIAGVMPVIFASSIMAIPPLIAEVIGKGYGGGWSRTFLMMMSQENWFDNEHPIYFLGLIIYLVLVIFFAYFYTPIAFNAREVSDGIRKSGGFLPGVRPGQATENYIYHISMEITVISIAMLLIAVALPIIICGSCGISTSIGGTSLIIVVGVSADLLQQVQLELAGRNYTGFVKK